MPAAVSGAQHRSHSPWRDRCRAAPRRGGILQDRI